MTRCDCRQCRERDAARFEAIIGASFTDAERARLDAVADAAGVPLAAILGPVPEWEDTRGAEDGA